MATVVAIECVAGGARAEEWGLGDAETVQSGDVVVELRIGAGTSAEWYSSRGASVISRAPFKGGRAGVQKLLHSAFKRGDTFIEVRARRPTAAIGDGEEEPTAAPRMQACIVPHDAAAQGVGRRQYVLRSIRDPNYAVGFVDRLESECVAIHGSRSSRIVGALSKAQLHDGFVSYPWEKKMREALTIANSSSFFTMLILPMAIDGRASRYSSLEDTLARAHAWFMSAQSSGVPIVFLNVQTEALLTKISGETASPTVNSGSLADLSDLANVSLYGFEDYHGVDIGVVRTARVWYTADAGEMPVEIALQEGDTRLGFAISRSDEGFIYVSSVTEDASLGATRLPSTRSGLADLFREAKAASRLLVISRIAGQKVLPWMSSASGAIRCYDTLSLSQKLSLHRHALMPILLHVLMWEKRPVGTAWAPSAPEKMLHPFDLFRRPPDELAAVEQASDSDGEGQVFEADGVGDISFRHNWV